MRLPAKAGETQDPVASPADPDELIFPLHPTTSAGRPPSFVLHGRLQGAAMEAIRSERAGAAAAAAAIEERRAALDTEAAELQGQQQRLADQQKDLAARESCAAAALEREKVPVTPNVSGPAQDLIAF